MRYKEGHKDETRERILKAASQLFRQKGYLGAGVDSVMKKVGLTAGGFYAHFSSKKNLLNEALRYALESVRIDLFKHAEKKFGEEWIYAVGERYLTEYHRDHVKDGCPMPPLISDISRSDMATRQVVEDHLYEFIKEYRNRVPGGDPELEKKALSVMAMCVGGITLARAVNEKDFSKKILEACLSTLKKEFT
jgi:TetR/AcrR family transcriptional repressor of nem operon